MLLCSRHQMFRSFYWAFSVMNQADRRILSISGHIKWRLVPFGLQFEVLKSLFNKDFDCLLLCICVWFTGLGDMAHSVCSWRGSAVLETSTFSLSNTTPGRVYIRADKGWEWDGCVSHHFWSQPCPAGTLQTAPSFRCAEVPGRILNCQTGWDVESLGLCLGLRF